MSKPMTEFVYNAAFPVSADVRAKDRPAAVEEEVIELFTLYRNPLLRYTISLGVSPQDGEEVIQEVFLALFRHLHLGRPRHNLRGWIFRVAHNLSLKQRAANQKAVALLDTNEAVSLRQPDTGPDPEQQAVHRQRWQRMQAILRALPEQDRCCLLLRAEGLRYREIAAVLGISLGSVSIALARSLARMKPVYEG